MNIMNEHKNTNISLNSTIKGRLPKASVSTLLKMTPFSREDGLVFHKAQKDSHKLFYNNFYYE